MSATEGKKKWSLAKMGLVGCLGLVAIIMLVSVAGSIGCFDLSPEEREALEERERAEASAEAAERARKEAEVASEEAQCRASLQCWGDRHRIAAGVYCKEPIERLAQYTHRWTDGILESKFSRFGWLNEAAGTLSFYGDKIEFQNGFGAWQPYRYTCNFNPANDQVLGVNADPGRLPL